MNEVLDKAPIGKTLQGKIVGTKNVCKDAKIWKVIQDIPEIRVKEGDWLYVDTLHKNHIEVFK